jgi:glyoxylase-like metal-dependent hydrolase (beta-lactamase superfamily II)
MKVIPLSEGAFTVDKTKNFIPFDPSTDDLQKRSRGSILVEIQPFLIITSTEILLLDTGLGYTDDEGRMQIHQALSQIGIQSGDITKVLISHLHKDHSGGIMLPNKRIPAFENATYYISRDEWQAALAGSSSYKPDDFKYLKNVYFTEGSGKIDDHIQYIFTGAHSPYHQAFKIVEDKEILFFGGDVASQSQLLRSRYKAKYDYQPELAMQLRQRWREEGEQNGWTFLFYHDIKFPVYHF